MGSILMPRLSNSYRKSPRNNKVWSTGKSYTGRKTIAVQYTHNPATDEIREDMALMRTYLGFVIKHVSGVQNR